MGAAYFLFLVFVFVGSSLNRNQFLFIFCSIVNIDWKFYLNMFFSDVNTSNYVVQECKHV
jgi:hypothetical protein